MEQTTEEIIVYSSVFLLCLAVVATYLLVQRKRSRRTEQKILKAKQDGLFEPVSLHPVVDPAKCIQTGACIAACPEKDILGIVNGKATTVNASRCIGHGACFHACPTQAITLCIGTEKRGVDLPHVDMTFETNVPGIYIAGELGGMGLIRNAVEQGRQAVDNIVKSGRKAPDAAYDVIVVGAGPAGISASLAAKKHHLRCLSLEQDTLGGTVFSFPRSKIVMTSPMELPLYGRVKLYETSKPELLTLWQEVIEKHAIEIRENSRVESILAGDDYFRVLTGSGETFTTASVVIAIGRRGTPRKLGVPGEQLEKVSYRLLEPETIAGKEILVVGGGDSAIESALLLAGQNHVTLSYRSDSFSRIKPKNQERIGDAIRSGSVAVHFSTQVSEIRADQVTLVPSTNPDQGQLTTLPNDLVFIFAGGELPTQFLERAGIRITRKFGEAILKHSKA